MLVIKFLLQNVEPLPDLFERHSTERSDTLIIQGGGESDLDTESSRMRLQRRHRAAVRQKGSCK